MTKKIKWRLSNLPTVDELLSLVNAKLITQDEAKEILFTQEDVEDRDKKSLESEIKFLKELVEKLSDNKRIIETIRVVEKHYNHYPWYQPYNYWTNAGSTGVVGSVTTSLVGAGTTSYSLAGGSAGTSLGVTNTAATGYSQVQPTSFSNIKTY